MEVTFEAPGQAALGEPTGEAPAERLGLIVADRHQLFRECLASALRGGENGSGKVTMVADPNEILARLAADENGGPRVLVLGMDGHAAAGELTREVRRRFPQVSVLVLVGGAGDHDDLAAMELLEAGAGGFLSRDQSLPELRQAIERVAAGETVCTPRVTHLLFSRLAELGRERRRSEKLDFLDLTARELEILVLLADGLSNQLIARRLFLSVHTVKNHVHNILDTLGVHSRWDAVHHAFNKGWLDDRRRLHP
ncbi:MAG TPA: response regulator transcription factor [Thermoanaerobaculia bacterium]|nr:response regulator transcription factor [Thermoanaerobaculia bacterium]